MAKNVNKRKSSVTLGEAMLGLAGVMFCLVLITTSMIGGMFARYSTSAAGEDSARVAKFGEIRLEETGDFDGTVARKGMIIPGVDLTKDVEVSFSGSEVATYVFVELKLSENWTFHKNANTFNVSKYLSWRVASGWTLLEGTEYVFYQAVAPNTSLEHVDVIDNNGIISVSEEITESTIGGLENTQIQVQAGVIQAGRFKTAADAWNALSGK